MARIINNKLSIIHQQGVALLVVLFIVMVITVTSIGFLSKSDVELACGRNMEIWTEVGYTGESGLEEARGLIISSQEIDSEYWTGGLGRQIGGGDDYYDLAIVRDDSDPTDRCNYTIDCNSYRLKGGEKVGRSSLTAQLRLDPCIAYWVGTNERMSRRITINGDMYCAGILGTQATINGDVFARSTISGAGIEGRSNRYVTAAPVAWPGLDLSDYSPSYYSGVISYSSENVGSSVHPSGTFGPLSGNPGGVRYYTDDCELPGDVNITGMLAIDGDLRVRGVNAISAVKNFPALLVTGDLIIEPGGELAVNGLAAVEGSVEVSSDRGDLDIAGALFARSGITETVVDSSGNGNDGVISSDIAWAPDGGHSGGGALEFDGTHDCVKVGNESNFDVIDQITVSAWIKVNAFTRAFQAIVTKGDNAWRIQRWSNTNYIEFACTGLGHNTYSNIIGNTVVNDNQWHHVAGVYDGTKMYLYIDGNIDVSTPTSGSINTNNYSVMIGENAQPSGRYWNGMIDDVRVYSRGLSAGEVNIIKAGGTVADPNNLIVGHWKLDEAGCEVEITAAPCKTALMTWASDGSAEKWEQVGGAFFRSITRRE
jgi:hypothetical protein